MTEEYQLEFPFMEQERIKDAYSKKGEKTDEFERQARIRGKFWNHSHSLSARAASGEGLYRRGY